MLRRGRTAGPLLIGILFTLVGCSSQALQTTTLDQGSTMSGLLEEMALDNLEMIRQDPAALPWHLKVTGGTITVQDQLNAPNYTYAWPVVAQTVGGNSLGQRQWNLQWAVTPEVDSKKLLDLQSEYLSWAKPQKFDANFLEGPNPPDKGPYGRFGSIYVWPRPGHSQALTVLVTNILGLAPVKPSERPMLVIGPR
jgi:hypothetical protein